MFKCPLKTGKNEEESCETCCPNSLQIPDEHILEILELRDAFQLAPSNASAAAKFRLWDAITKIFPHVRDHNQWSIDIPDAYTVRINRGPGK